MHASIGIAHCAGARRGSRPRRRQTIAEIAAYQGPDRTKRLIAGAKKEKAVTVYGSTVAEDMRPVSDAFRKKYGIDFQYWRASSEQLVQRAVNENRAGRCAGRRLCDGRGGARVAAPREAPAGGQDAGHRRSDPARRSARTANGWRPGSTSSPPPSTPTWSSARRRRRPTRTCKHPRWKGRLAVEAADFDWFGTIVMKMGEEKGLQALPRHRRRPTACRCARATRCWPTSWPPAKCRWR